MTKGLGRLRGRRERASLAVGALLLVIVAFTALPGAADPGDLTTIVKGGFDPANGEKKCTDSIGDEGANVPLSEARFNMNSPFFTVAASNAGTVYIGDSNWIRMISGSNLVTVAGKPGGTATNRNASVAQDLAFQASGLAVGPTGRVFVADTSGGSLRVLGVDVGAGTATVLGSDPAETGFAHLGLAVDGRNALYVPEPTAGRVSKVSGSGGMTPVATGLNHPRAVAVDLAGQHLFVADDGGAVKEYDPQSGQLRATLELSLTPGDGNRVAIDPDGKILFVGDRTKGVIFQVDVETGKARPYAGPSTGNGASYANGLSVAGKPPHLYVADNSACTVDLGVPLERESSPPSSQQSSPVSTNPSNNTNNTNPTVPGNTANNSSQSPNANTSANNQNVANTGGSNSNGNANPTDASSQSALNTNTNPNPGGTTTGNNGVNGGLSDTGGRLTADDIVTQLLGGRSDGAFGGSQAVFQPDPAVLGAPGARGEAFFGGDLGGLAAQQGAVGGVPPGPPPGVLVSPGPLASAGPIGGAPAPLVGGVPGQIAGLPPLPHGQLNPPPAWGGASAEPAEGAPRYAMVRNDDDGLGAGVVLTSLLVLGGCTLLFALGTARGGRDGPGPASNRSTSRAAPARAWAR